MKKQISILFIGSFLSQTNGSLCVSEKIAESLNEFGFSTKISSRKKNRFLRLIEIISTIVFSKSKIVVIDVYSGRAFFITEIAVFLSKKRKKKLVLTLHGGGLHLFYQKHNRRMKWVLSSACIVTTPSTMLKSFFEERGFSITLIPNSIDFNDFPFNRDSIITNSILWVRAFDKIYNPELAIEALHQLKSKFKNARLTMIGPDKGRLDFVREMAVRLDLLDSIDFVGPVSNRKLFKYYQSHEVYINTTSLESFGVALLEAASCGIPIVSTSVGEVPRMWEESKDILLISDFDGTEMSNQIGRYFNDKEFAKFVSKNAKKKASQYGWIEIRPKWIDLINRINE